jgi:hypothetical protein
MKRARRLKENMSKNEDLRGFHPSTEINLKELKTDSEELVFKYQLSVFTYYDFRQRKYGSGRD